MGVGADRLPMILLWNFFFWVGNGVSSNMPCYILDSSALLDFVQLEGILKFSLHYYISAISSNLQCTKRKHDVVYYLFL